MRTARALLTSSAATFLSDVRQPDVGFLYSPAVILNTFYSKSSLNMSKLLVKTLSNTNLVALYRLIKREKGSILAAMTRRRDDFWHDQDATDDRQLRRGQQQQQGTETLNLYWHSELRSDLLLTFFTPVPLPFPCKIISWAHEISAAYFFKKVVHYVWCIVI